MKKISQMEYQKLYRILKMEQAECIQEMEHVISLLKE